MRIKGKISARCEGASGFSLIELLVVVSIIALLASILFPVFTRARESARKSSCASNERQLGVAFLAYADDYKEVLPPSVIQIKGQWRPWDVLLMPYVKNTKVFACPSDSEKRAIAQLPRSYSMNDQMYLRHNAWTSQGIALGSVPGSSRYVLLTEWHHSDNSLGAAVHQTMFYPPDASQQCHYGGEGNNFLFYDGHVKYYRYGELNQADYRFFDKML